MGPSRRWRVSATSALDEWRDIWPGIENARAPCHAFQTRQFLEIWLATIGAARGVEPLFVRIDSLGGEPLMLLPLGVEHRRGVRVLTFLDGGVCDYNAPIIWPALALHNIHPRQISRALIEAAGGVDVIAFDKMPFVVARRLNPLAQLGAPSPPSGYLLTLDGDWRTYSSTRLHRPKDSRRKRRRMAEAGPVRLVLGRDRDEIARLYQTLVLQKTGRYLEKTGKDGFDRPGYRTYFARMTEEFSASGAVQLAAFEVGGEPLASHWGIVWGDRLYSVLLAYSDAPLARYSPARLLMEDLIAWCFANGIREIDFGVGDDRWKTQLGARGAPLAHVFEPLTPLGWAYCQAHRIKRQFAARELVRRRTLPLAAAKLPGLAGHALETDG